jgi:TfoX/Sxy family transcriptional regulator of competence genes
MAYDHGLGDRVRAVLVGQVPFEERAMFGGLAFMVNTHMACGIIGEDLMVRVGKQAHDAAIARGAQELVFTGRPMRGMVTVDGEGLGDDDLASWVGQAVALAQSEPPKAPKAPKRP